MHRFFVPGIRDSHVEVALPAAEVHHAARVLRIQPGERVVLLDGIGGEFSGIITAAGRREVLVRVTGCHRHVRQPFEITLFQAIAKGPAMEGLIHRAVELGCARIVPLLTERSVSRPDDASAKQARWESVAVEAAKQSGNPWCMSVAAPVTPAAWLAAPHGQDVLLIASLEDDPVHPLAPLIRHQQEHGHSPRSLGVLIGPEGDFTPAEYSAFRSAGARPISLGPHVLRVETAATAVLALLTSGLQALASGVVIPPKGLL